MLHSSVAPTIDVSSNEPERTSIAPVAFSSYPPPPASQPQPKRLRWFVTSMLPVLSFVLAAAAAYAAPPPKYEGPPAQPAITLPDIIVIDQASATPDATNDTVTPEALPVVESAAPIVWVYDLPAVGRGKRPSAGVTELPLTVSPDELPTVRGR